MNIRDAIDTYNKARGSRGISRARLALAAQHMAAQCRSRRKDDLMFHSHALAVGAAATVLKESADHAQRSEAGRIRVASQYAFNGFRA